MKPGHIIPGAALVAAGALAPLWVPFGLVGGLALLALIRICWLEDNITSDLFGRDSLPDGYRNTARFRRSLLFRCFGILPEEGVAEGSAHLMATAMRTEVQIWTALLLGLTAMVVTLFGPFGMVVNAGLGLAVFIVALTRADRLAMSLAYCEAGKPLPDRLLLPIGRRVSADRER